MGVLGYIHKSSVPIEFLNCKYVELTFFLIKYVKIQSNRTKTLLFRNKSIIMSLSYIPGGRRIKKYLLKIIGGIILLPVGPILLLWNEYHAINQTPLFDDNNYNWLYWSIRIVGFLFISCCFYQILSAIKLFMSKIPLTYQEIRNGILLSSFLLGIIITMVCLSMVWIYHKPLISLVLGATAISIIISMLLRRRSNRIRKKLNEPSVRPHQVKDT